ncbi:MAG: CPBP family intramembrane metalloprotease [Flavobacteriales bacterium]|nr:CPBP family intramembrane metalloprotease [Flavobacteriales bacterium]
MKFNNDLNLLGGDTLFGMGLIGLVVLKLFFPDDFLSRFTSEYSIIENILAGGVTGLLTAWIAEWMLDLKSMKKVKDKYENILGPIELNFWERLWISLCAGIGEEILFRAFLQWALMYFFGFWPGIILTSIVFVGIHGYLNPKEGKLAVYGMFLTAAMILWSYFSEEVGIYFIISAHAVYDFYLLSQQEESPLQTDLKQS